MSDILWKYLENSSTRFSIISIKTTDPENRKKSISDLWGQLQHPWNVPDYSQSHVRPFTKTHEKSVHSFFHNVAHRHRNVKRNPVCKGLNIPLPNFTDCSVYLPQRILKIHVFFSVMMLTHKQTYKPTEIKTQPSPFGRGNYWVCYHRNIYSNEFGLVSCNTLVRL